MPLKTIFGGKGNKGLKPEHDGIEKYKVFNVVILEWFFGFLENAETLRFVFRAPQKMLGEFSAFFSSLARITFVNHLLPKLRPLYPSSLAATGKLKTNPKNKASVTAMRRKGLFFWNLHLA